MSVQKRRKSERVSEIFSFKDRPHDCSKNGDDKDLWLKMKVLNGFSAG
jgi:hypothetical protein